MPLLSLMRVSKYDGRATVHGDRDESELDESELDESELHESELEKELRRAAAHFDPVPRELLQAAADAFDWRAIDAELAELVFDSLVDHDELALVRGPLDRRLLSFHAGGMTIDLEVTSTSTSCGLVGQLVPPQQASVEIRTGTDVITVEADELGRFSAGPVPKGPLSLRCAAARAGPGTAVVTEWVPI